MHRRTTDVDSPIPHSATTGMATNAHEQEDPVPANQTPPHHPAATGLADTRLGRRGFVRRAAPPPWP